MSEMLAGQLHFGTCEIARTAGGTATATTERAAGRDNQKLLSRRA
jgi:hypothetical protein